MPSPGPNRASLVRVDCALVAQICFLELSERRLNQLEGFVNVLARLRSCQNYLARGEDEQADFRVLQVIDQTREGFRIEDAVLAVRAVVHRLQADFVVHRAGSDHVLDLEVRQIDGIVCDTLDRLRVVLCSLLRLLLAFRSGDDHLAVFEDERRRTRGLSQPHDQGCESFRVVLRIAAMVTYFFQV